MSILPIIATAAIAAPCGFLVCAFLTAGRVNDLNADLFAARDANDANIAHKNRYFHEAADAQEAHSRCADALQQNRDRIESALLQITPGANATVKRIERILRGEA